MDEEDVDVVEVVSCVESATAVALDEEDVAAASSISSSNRFSFSIH